MERWERRKEEWAERGGLGRSGGEERRKGEEGKIDEKRERQETTREDKAGQEKRGQEWGGNVLIVNIITSCVHLNSCI